MYDDSVSNDSQLILSEKSFQQLMGDIILPKENNFQQPKLNNSIHSQQNKGQLNNYQTAPSPVLLNNAPVIRKGGIVEVADIRKRSKSPISQTESIIKPIFEIAKSSAKPRTTPLKTTNPSIYSNELPYEELRARYISLMKDLNDKTAENQRLRNENDIFMRNVSFQLLQLYFKIK